MNMAIKRSHCALLCALSAGIVMAQSSPPAPPAVPAAGSGAPAKAARESAQIDAGEPRADTSPTAAGASADPGAGDAPSPATPAHTVAASRATKSPPAKVPGAADRVELGTATVTGDREQPKVMYIVPWKKSDIGDGSGKPMNSLLDEALAPVDRDEFKREVAYYDAMNADTAQNGAQKPASKQGEK